MIKLFFDIETISCDEDKKEEYMSILRAKNGNGKLSDKKLFESMSLEGTFGRIACIGYIKEDGSITKEVLSGDEKEMLLKFWEVAAGVDLFVGHNILEFDLPFIYKRSIILGVKPGKIYMGKFQEKPVYDTQCIWDNWAFKKSQKLDTLAKVLGLPSSKDEMDGSMVWDYYKEGKLEDICKYCMKDVELVRQVYYRMTFEEMLLPEEIKEQVEDDVNF